MNRVETIIRSKCNKEDKLAKILHYVFIKMCDINQAKYFILGSYAIRKQRTINDLDINLDHNEFLKLHLAVSRGFGHIEFYNNQIRWFFDLTSIYNRINKTKEKDFSIEAFQKERNTGFPTNTYSLSKLRRVKGLSIDKYGHQYFSLKTLLKWKQKMNHPKDLNDIEIIKSLLLH